PPGAGTPAAVVPRLYAANTFGAAAGAVIANYLVLPWLGLYGGLAAVFAVDLYVFARAARLAARSDRGADAAPTVLPEVSPGAETALRASAPGRLDAEPAASAPRPALPVPLALAALFV